MRYHLVAMPHTQSTKEYSNCAFNSLLRGFASMMDSLGHEVFVYSGEDNDAAGKHFQCIDKATQKRWFNVESPFDILKPPLDSIMYNTDRPWWPMWNQMVWEQMQHNLETKDFVGLIGGGILFEPLITSILNRGAMAVEYAIGYAGISSRTFHAFGSDNWRHVVYGLNPPKDWSGSFYDRTIPHYFDPNDFTFEADKDEYFLYLGKVKEDKGVNVAARAAKAAGQRLIVAGDGPTPVEYGEVRRHYIGPDERRELLAGARALFAPSLYVEPFGMIAVEAMLSGTPIITTPFGGFGDINIDGVTGFKCNTLKDFVDAVNMVDDLNPYQIRDEGLKYSYDVVRHQYQRWFDDLSGLWGEGWGAL